MAAELLRLPACEVCRDNIKSSKSFRPMEQCKTSCNWKTGVASFFDYHGRDGVLPPKLRRSIGKIRKREA